MSTPAFAPITTNSVLTCPILGTGERLLLVYLLHQGEQCTLPICAIAEALAISKETIAAWLRTLEAGGWIRRTRRGAPSGRGRATWTITILRR